MKRFSKLAVVAIWLAAIWIAAPVSAWAGPVTDQGENANTSPESTSPASHASGKGAHNYWLGRDIGRLALLLPSRKVEDTTRR